METVLQRVGIKQNHYIGHSNSQYLTGINVKASYVLLHLVDLILTIFGVSLGLSELNSIMKSLLSTPLELLVFKLAIPIVIAWFVPWKFLLPAIALLVMVICWNIKELILYVF